MPAWPNVLNPIYMLIPLKIKILVQNSTLNCKHISNFVFYIFPSILLDILNPTYLKRNSWCSLPPPSSITLLLVLISVPVTTSPLDVQFKNLGVTFDSSLPLTAISNTLAIPTVIFQNAYQIQTLVSRYTTSTLRISHLSHCRNFQSPYFHSCVFPSIYYLTARIYFLNIHKILLPSW